MPCIKAVKEDFISFCTYSGEFKIICVCAPVNGKKKKFSWRHFIVNSEHWILAFLEMVVSWLLSLHRLASYRSRVRYKLMLCFIFASASLNKTLLITISILDDATSRHVPKWVLMDKDFSFFLNLDCLFLWQSLQEELMLTDRELFSLVEKVVAC